MIIAIDGPSGTEKSTVAKEVAKRLKFSFFDTGAMYRSFAWKVLKEKIDPENEGDVLKVIPHFSMDVKNEGKKKKYFVDGEENLGIHKMLSLRGEIWERSFFQKQTLKYSLQPQ